MVIVVTTVTLLAWAVHRQSTLGASATLLVGIAIASLLQRVCVHSRLVVTAEGLEIYNPLSAAERVSWDEVGSLDRAAFLRVRCSDGRIIRVWGVQANNIDLVRGTRTYVDEVADSVENLGGVPHDPARSGPDVRASNRLTGIAVVVGFILFILVLRHHL